MGTTRLYFFLCTSLLATGLTACGDDDGAVCGDGTSLEGDECVADDVDGGSVTCGEGTVLVNSECVPEDQAPVVDYDSDEGGEVRVEYIRFPNGGVGARGTAFFYKDAGTTKFFPYLNLNGCTDFSTKDKWPEAQNPIAQRQYYDVGTNVVLTGGPAPYVIGKNANGEDTTTVARDPFGRGHKGGQWYFDNATSADMDGATYFGAAKNYDVTLPGSADFPGAFFDDAIYMPADFALTTPGNTPAPLVFPANTPQTFTFTVPTEAAPPGIIIRSLVALTGPAGPIVVCVEPNDGSVTIPAALMDVARAKYPGGAAGQGTVARQTISHQVRELVDNTGHTGKRIDFLGVWCYAGQQYLPTAP